MLLLLKEWASLETRAYFTWGKFYLSKYFHPISRPAYISFVLGVKMYYFFKVFPVKTE